MEKPKKPMVAYKRNMQSNENVLTNTKSFQEIWATLNMDEKDDLCLKLFQKRCCKSRQAIRHWGAGARQPQSPLVRDAIADVMTKFTGSRCFAHTLFPSA